MSLIKDIFSSVEKLLLGSLSSALSSIEGVNIKGVGRDFRPGDIELIDIILMSEDQQRAYSLISNAATIDIYESILSPTMWCELTIADSSGLLQNFPIIGEEYVKIVFRTPGSSGEPAEYLMRVNAVLNKQANESNKRMTYTLQCCSAELITNAKLSVTLTESSNIDAIVKRIVDEYVETEKPLFVEATDGIEDVRITNLSPYQAIDFLRQRAVSNRYQSSSFCFYENRKGLHFALIEKMLEEGARIVESGNTDKIFFYDTARKDSLESVTMRNIIAFNQIQFGDSISQVASGGLNNEVQEFDLITGDLRTVTYTDNIGADEFKSSSSTSSGTHTTSFTRRHGRETTVTRTRTTRSDRPLIDHAEKMTKLQAYAQKIAQNIMQIHIYGDSAITIGDVVELKLPSAVDTGTDSGEARLTSGSYMVSKVRHMILNNDRPQYTQALELIKTDLQEVSS